MARITDEAINNRSGGDKLALSVGDALGTDAGDKEVLSVTHLAHLADAFALLIVDPDLAPDIARMIPIEHHQRPALGEDGFDLLAGEVPLVVE